MSGRVRYTAARSSEGLDDEQITDECEETSCSTPKVSSIWCCGHHAINLGQMPIMEKGGLMCTDKAVSLLLHELKLQSVDKHQVYVDVKSVGLVMYHVDENMKITNTRLFDLARISYCTADHQVEPHVFAWVYHQETLEGFQMQCYAVKMNSVRKAKMLAFQLNAAFRSLYEEVQAAEKSSQIFAEAACKQKTATLKVSTAESEQHFTLKDSKQYYASPYIDNMKEDNDTENCKDNTLMDTNKENKENNLENKENNLCVAIV